MLAVFLAALDNTIIATAGPSIQRALLLNAGMYAWLTTAYLITSTVFVPLYGKLSDEIGRKPVLLTGIAIFLLGSIGCGLSQNVSALIAMRAVQGVGAAALFTTAFALIADLYPPGERARMTGLIGATFGLSSVLGPLAGGIITQTFGWRWNFWINVPLACLALIFITAFMPRWTHRPFAPRRPFDTWGAAALLLGSIPLLIALAQGRPRLEPGQAGFLWLSWPTFALVLLSILGTIAFIRMEQRAPNPLLNIAFFRSPLFSKATLAAFLVGMVFLGPMIFLPLYLVNVVGLSAMTAGATIIPLSLGIVAGTVITGQLLHRFQRPKSLMLATLGLMLTALTILGFTLTVHTGVLDITLKMVFLGLSLGPAIPLYTLTAQQAAPAEETGAATAVVTFARQLGNVCGVALLGSIFASTVGINLQHTKTTVLNSLPASTRSEFSTYTDQTTQTELNIQRIREDVLSKIDERGRVITKAIMDNDPASVAIVLNDPRTPQVLREPLSGGGIVHWVRERHRHKQQQLQNALVGGEPSAIRRLLSADDTPFEVREALLIGTPSQRRALAERLLKDGPNNEANEIFSTQRTRLDGAMYGLNAARSQVRQALDVFEVGLKEALTLALRNVFQAGLIVALLALLVTLTLPGTKRQTQLARVARGELLQPPQPSNDITPVRSHKRLLTAEEDGVKRRRKKRLRGSTKGIAD
nr:MDR family MFS transporter [Deinococcus hopiensis]